MCILTFKKDVDELEESLDVVQTKTNGKQIVWERIYRCAKHLNTRSDTFLSSTTGCSGKIVFFFTIHCNPSLAYIAVRALNSMWVYSHSYWLVVFCTTNSSRVLAREKWHTSCKKTTKFKEHPVSKMSERKWLLPPIITIYRGNPTLFKRSPNHDYEDIWNPDIHWISKTQYPYSE